jgi:hypothetical protein
MKGLLGMLRKFAKQQQGRELRILLLVSLIGIEVELMNSDSETQRILNANVK